MKKRLLFVIDSLGIGGAERSLVTLLNLLDYSRYKVDLQLFTHDGAFEQFLPVDVNLLPELDAMGIMSQPLHKLLRHPAMLISRVRYSLTIRARKLSIAERACLYWRLLGRYFGPKTETYDVAIAYAQGLPTFYVASHVSARKKLAWVNVDYRISGRTRDYHRIFYQQTDIIVPVSEAVRELFASEVYPEFRHKMRIMPDIVDGSIVERMSLSPSDKPIDKTAPVIMTAGRLNKPQKGYDLALAAAKILRDRGVDFRWYAVGEGPYRAEMERYIAENELQERFVLLGATANPYSYMRQCDVYVQTSRHEGYGLTIAEARILDRPVVCTNFEGCTAQMTDGKNGLVTSFAPEDIADAIERLLNDKELYSDIREYLKNEKKGNTEEIAGFYKLIES